MNKIFKIQAALLLLCTCLLGNSFAQVDDPGLPGPLAVTKQYYDLGDEAFDPPTFPDLVEVVGTVHHPTDLSGGPYPVIVILHGRHTAMYNPSTGATSHSWPPTGGFEGIPSYDGYDFLGNHLASHGYIVISISANSISATDNSTPDYGMQARAELIQHHLDLWNGWNTSDATGPFGSDFFGALDLSNVGTLGHSRGGEGVITHALHNEDLGRPYGVNAVFTLAPVDFNRPILTGIPVLNLAPYCDGDVSDLQGVHFYDDARYLMDEDTTEKYNITVFGSNHNFYNTYWTPALFSYATGDDWGYVNPGQNDIHCGTGSGTSGRLSYTQQQTSLTAYASAFFRYHIGGETEFAPILQVDSIVPPASAGIDENQIWVTYHPPYNKSVIINTQDAEGSEVTNDLGEAVTQNGLVQYDVCGDDFGEQYCMSAGAAQQPHQKMGSVSYLGLSQLEVEWNSADDWYRNDLPVYLQDLTQFKALQFRASVNFDDSPAGTAQDFKVELTDLSGSSSTVLVSDYSTALYFPPGDFGSTLPRMMANSVKIPLSAFTGIDMTQVEYIRFIFDETAAGAVLISDLMVSGDDEVAFAPIAAFSANTLFTCSGEVSFTDESAFTPTAWSWDFGDGIGTSTDENPTYTYASDGTYTVTLTVTNDEGMDTHTEVAYIVVDKPAAPSGTGDSDCPGYTADLSVTGTGGTLNWYDDAIGGTLVNTGSTYNLVITTPTSYFVEELVDYPVQTVGPADNTYGGGGYFAFDTRGLFFDAIAPFEFISVKMYAGSAGTRTIQILDGDGGSVIHEMDVDLVAGENIVTLNWDIDVYSGYWMTIDGMADVYRNNDAATAFPYTIPGLVSITGNNVTGAAAGDYYYYFYDWNVREPGCVSERVEILADTDPAPAITLSGDVTIIGGESTTLTVTGTADTYLWTPSTGLDDPSSMTPIATPSVTTTYTCAASFTGGCTTEESLTVTVSGQVGLEDENETSQISIFPNPSTGLINISGVGINENQVSVLNAAGQIVAASFVSTNDNTLQVDLSNLERGMYFINIITVDGNVVERIVLQ